MTVKDLFDKFDFQDIWNHFYENYLKNDDDTNKHINNCKKSHHTAFTKIKNTEIKEPNKNNILIGHKVIDYDECDNITIEYIDVSLYHLDEIKENFKIDKKLEPDFDYSKASLEELKTIIREYLDYNSYAYEFSPWEEILSFTIEETSLKDIGELEFICAVFNEMTFVGFDNEEIELERKALEKLTEKLKEYDVEDEKPKSWREIFDKMEIPPITYEQRKKSWLTAIENKRIIYPYIKKLVES